MLYLVLYFFDFHVYLFVSHVRVSSTGPRLTDPLKCLELSLSYVMYCVCLLGPQLSVSVFNNLFEYFHVFYRVADSLIVSIGVVVKWLQPEPKILLDVIEQRVLLKFILVSLPVHHVQLLGPFVHILLVTFVLFARIVYLEVRVLLKFLVMFHLVLSWFPA